MTDTWNMEEYFVHLKKTIETAERNEQKMDRILKMNFVRNLFLYSALFFAIFYLVTSDRITNVMRLSLFSVLACVIPLAISIIFAAMGLRRYYKIKEKE